MPGVPRNGARNGSEGMAAVIVTEKRDFLRELFSSNPSLTLNDAQFVIKRKFGSAMNRGTLARCKREILGLTSGEREEIKANAGAKKLLAGLYAFFNKQDPEKLAFDDADLALIVQVEKAIK